MWYVYLIIFVENQTFKRILCNKSKNHLLPCSLKLIVVCFSSVQLLSRVWLCDPKDCSTPGLPVHHQLLEFTQTHVHWVSEASNHLILCRPLLLPPSIFPSIRVFSNESVLCIRWPKYLNKQAIHTYTHMYIKYVTYILEMGNCFADLSLQ